MILFYFICICFTKTVDQVRSALKSTASNHGMESMYFKFSDKVTQTSNVTKAHLWLYLNGLPTNPATTNHGKTNASVCITVFQVIGLFFYKTKLCTNWLYGFRLFL